MRVDYVESIHWLCTDIELETWNQPTRRRNIGSYSVSLHVNDCERPCHCGGKVKGQECHRCVRQACQYQGGALRGCSQRFLPAPENPEMKGSCHYYQASVIERFHSYSFLEAFMMMLQEVFARSNPRSWQQTEDGDGQEDLSFAAAVWVSVRRALFWTTLALTSQNHEAHIRSDACVVRGQQQ